MSQDEPYDVTQPFDAERFAEGFEETAIVHHVDADSPLGRAMAEARERGIPDEPTDITDWKGTPVTE